MLKPDELQLQIHQRLLEKLSESERKLKTICNSALDAIIMVDHEHRVTFWNCSAERMFSYSSMEAITKKLEDLIIPEAERQLLFTNISDEEVAAGTVIELNGITKDKRCFPIEASVSSIKINEEKSLVWVVRDITKRKELEQAQQLLKEERHQRLEALGLMAGGIAHDFNNLLLPIIGNIEMAMQQQADDSATYTQLQTALDASLQAARLSRQMLAYSGSGRLNAVVVNLSTMLSDMQPVLKASVADGITLRFELDRSIGSVSMDVSEVEQVILNLVINASDAIRGNVGAQVPIGSEICVSTRSVHSDELPPPCIDMEQPAAGDYIALAVKDNGCGMSRDVQKKLFDPFFTTKFTGRGLGMAAVRGIVAHHKGYISLQSEEGKGSSFTVALPAQAKQKAKDTPVMHDDEGLPLPAAHVLIVDDDAFAQMLLQARLTALGMSCVVANNGLEGVEIYRAQQADIDVVILDMVMPVMAGDECFVHLMDINPEVKVILSSGYASDDLNDKFDIDAIAGFLPKPYQTQQLREVLAQVLLA